MWNDDNDYTTGGGFDVNASQYGSPTVAGNDSKQSRKPNSLFPVTIKQILDNTEDSMTISGYPVSMMTVVGIVRNIELTSTKIVYTVQDWSGIITGMLWLEGETGDDQKSTNVIENTYCRMTGTKRMQDSKPCLFIYSIVPIENLTELTYHFLQIVHIPLKAAEMAEQSVNQLSIPNSHLDVTMSNVMGSTDGLSLTPHQRQVYGMLQMCQNDTGMHKKLIFEELKSRMSMLDIEKALEFLTSEGHVYCTIDDEHFKVTDA